MTNYGKLLKRAALQMNKAMDQHAKQFGLTGMQMSFIDFIGNQGGCLQRDIEAEFSIQRSTATVALQRMEAQGLITRHPAAVDARQKAVALTPKAAVLHQDVAAYIQGQQAAMDAAFSPAKCQQFVTMLNHFITLNGGVAHE